MTQRKLLILTGVLVVLGLVAYWSSRPPRPQATEGLRTGDPLLADLDLNAITAITIASSNQTAELARKDGTWVAGNLHDYPVDFDKLRGQLTAFPDLKVGQVVRGGESMLEELGLGDGRTTVSFRDGNGGVLAELRLGDARTARQDPQFGGMPDGHYVRVGDGPVAVVAESLSAWTADPAAWIRKQLLQITGTTIRRVTVTHPDGQYSIAFPAGGSGEVDGLAEGETTNTGNAGRLQRALSYLSCQTVADPGLPAETTGMDSPIVYTAVDDDGVTYTAMVGAETTNDGRYVRFDITYEEPAPPTRADAEALVPDEVEPSTNTEPEEPQGDEAPPETAPPPADREQRITEQLETLTREHETKVQAVRDRVAELAFLKDWTYVIPAYSAGSMILTRGEVVNAPVPEADEATTDAESPETTAEANLEPVQTDSTPAEPPAMPPDEPAADENGSEQTPVGEAPAAENPPVPPPVPAVGDDQSVSVTTPPIAVPPMPVVKEPPPAE